MFEKELNKLGKLYKQGLFDKDFYARRISGEAVFSDYSEFIKIPFMYKNDIRETTATERTATPADQVYGIFSSSGTTGEKTYYIYNKKDKIVHEHFVKTFYTELGIQPTDLGGVFAPVDTGVMAHTMMWQFTTMGAGYVNCPEPSPENMIDVISHLPVSVIATRPSVVTSIADNKEYIEIARKSSVKKLLMGGGFLSSERRKLIENIWNADCYNMFGMSEMFGPMAGECPYKDGQHYLDDYIMIEIVDPETHLPVQPGKIGIAVYTSLWDKGFPLLRYWTDDLMWIDDSPCSCGCGLPRIRYKGRMADHFMINGEYIFPEMLENCLMRNGFILEYKAVMDNNGSVEVTIEKAPGQEITDTLVNELNILFDTKVKITTVPPHALKYNGHSPRFSKREIL